MAVAVAQPTDVVKVRFQAQVRTGSGRRYQGTMDAYKTIAREEGIRGLWKGQCWGQAGHAGLGPARPPTSLTRFSARPGTSPNVARNAIVNCTELVTYDLIKDLLLRSNLMTGGAGACGQAVRRWLPARGDYPKVLELPWGRGCSWPLSA